MAINDDYVINLFSRYRSKGILIDTNLLLLHFIGKYDPRRIVSFERTRSRAFTVEDFILLESIFAYFDKVITTPNILTEVSNLSGKLSSDERPIYHQEFARQVALLGEEYNKSAVVCSYAHFKQFGLTDSGIIKIVKDKYLVLTDDGPLYGYLQSVGIDTINFNHVRFMG
ncbi:MAG: hypothetical protein V7641_3042 [Blastocatellia bacterium]